MGYAYTPGLTVAEHTVIRKVRRLPLKGRVLVTEGQPVAAQPFRYTPSRLVMMEKIASTTITRKIDCTTLTVVCRPTLSALPSTRKPW